MKINYCFYYSTWIIYTQLPTNLKPWTYGIIGDISYLLACFVGFCFQLVFRWKPNAWHVCYVLILGAKPGDIVHLKLSLMDIGVPYGWPAVHLEPLKHPRIAFSHVTSASHKRKPIRDHRNVSVQDAWGDVAEMCVPDSLSLSTIETPLEPTDQS